MLQIMVFNYTLIMSIINGLNWEENSFNRDISSSICIDETGFH